MTFINNASPLMKILITGTIFILSLRIFIQNFKIILHLERLIVAMLIKGLPLHFFRRGKCFRKRVFANCHILNKATKFSSTI